MLERLYLDVLDARPCNVLEVNAMFWDDPWALVCSARRNWVKIFLPGKTRLGLFQLGNLVRASIMFHGGKGILSTVSILSGCKELYSRYRIMSQADIAIGKCGTQTLTLNGVNMLSHIQTFRTS